MIRAALAASFARGCPQLAGVFHLAGVLADAALTTLDGQGLRAAFRPKCDGLLALQQVTEGMDLHLFVNFSSLASLAGSPGQAAYAAANAFLDAHAAYQRARGVAATTI